VHGNDATARRQGPVDNFILHIDDRPMPRGTIGVVGAGGAGLVAAQALVAAGLEPVVYEARDGPGGNWRYDPKPGRSSAYASLTANTSRWRTSLRTQRLARRGPTHAGREEMLAYLEGFATRFGLDTRIRTHSEVVETRPDAAGRWSVRIASGEVEDHDAIVVATGYNSVPLMPDWPGSLDGPVLHTHDYRTPDPFADRDVVVVGMGSSATDLACEISCVARSVTIVARSGRDVIAKRLGPIPVDLFDTALNARLPWAVRRRIVAAVSRMTVGDLTKYGLPAPPRRCGDAPIAVSSELARALRDGTVKGTTGSIARLDGDHVTLADGRRLPCTALLAGTGYRAEFPFLPAEAEAPTLARPVLYRGVASPVLQGLFFVGIIAGHGALLPMFEAQAAWIAAVLSGRLVLPDQATMQASIADDARVLARDFDPRFGYLIDRMPYVLALHREARRSGPVPRAARAALR
jgi:cation diffusion facilitator CzcD-associated flavoprotein CzcO